MGIFEKIFGTYSERELKKIQPYVDAVLKLEDKYSKMSEKELKLQTNILKERLSKGETLDDILPDAFAVVREASWRVLKMKHYPVQIMGGIILHQGRIAEQSTGEGKTLVATLPSYLNALTGNGVLVVTVNDYLAKRDSVWMGKIYNYLGLSVGLITHDVKQEDRKAQYHCDITYGTNNEIGFDYLRDNMVVTKEMMVQRPFNYAIIDEVDSILIDEARTPLIISGFNGDISEGYKKADAFVKGLRKKVIVEEEIAPKLSLVDIPTQDYSDYDYVVEEKKNTSTLTARGIEKAEKYYGVENLSDAENVEINHFIQRSLKAYGLFKKDVHYVVKDGKVIIVDESTGRLMDGRRYSDGIHQAIEAKEKVNIQQESKTLASITFQNFFRKFKKLAGMTGTAMTEEEEFRGIYGLDVVQIPPNKPLLRLDKEDSVFITRKDKINFIVERIKECYSTGQPILVGTVSVDKSEELSSILKKEKIKHTVLNAKYHEQEAKIVAQAGKIGSVTIATNMAGRGTDIILGGNPEYMALEELKKKGYSEELINEATSHSETEDPEILNIRSLFSEIETKIKKELEPEIAKVKELGGLYILGTERHESRRIDNQLRGRSGRQGDVGVSEFVLSLEDDLMRLYGAEKLTNMCKAMNMPTDVPIDARILSKSIEKAQMKIEGVHFDIRKNVLQYDEVLNRQRELIYTERQKWLEANCDFYPTICTMIKDIITTIVGYSISNNKLITEEDIELLKNNLGDCSKFIDWTNFKGEELDSITKEEIIIDIRDKTIEKLDKVKATNSDEYFNTFCKRLLLFLIDNAWQDHMIAIDDLKQGINFRAYAQEDPLIAFKLESFEMFDAMMDSIREEVLKTILAVHNNLFPNKY